MKQKVQEKTANVTLPHNATRAANTTSQLQSVRCFMPYNALHAAFRAANHHEWKMAMLGTSSLPFLKTGIFRVRFRAAATLSMKLSFDSLTNIFLRYPIKTDWQRWTFLHNSKPGTETRGWCRTGKNAFKKYLVCFTRQHSTQDGAVSRRR